MKRLLILTIFGSCMFFMSCTKNFLNRLPLDQYSNAILWSDSSDADAALNGVYNGKNSGASDNASGWADGFLVNYMDCASDNAYSQFVWEGFQDFGNGLVTPSDGNADDLWSPCYVTIQKANFFLQNIGNTPMSASAKASMIAQVRFIRAYQYFMLTQLYGDAVFDTTTVSTTEANTASRTPKATIIKFDLSELAAAAADLPVSYPAAQQGHITKGAALALKMRIELYEADYIDCIADAQSVMNLGIYSLYPSYTDLFRIGNNGNGEDILSVQYMENIQSNGTLGVMLPNSIGGWSSIDPLQALVDNYEMSNGKPITDPASGYDSKHPYDKRDPRLKQTILVPGGSYADGSIMYYDPLDAKSSDYYSGNNCSRTGYEVLKFTSYQKADFDNIWNTGLDMMLIRYAEVLLSYAEAKIELGQIDGTVYAAINKVRERAGLPDVDQGIYSSQSTLRTLIRRERRSEFAMEGLRWFDVQRWQLGPQVMTGQVYGAPFGSVNAADGTVTFSGGNIPVETRLFDQAKNYLWPIPQAQRNIDKNLSQNPGYSE